MYHFWLNKWVQLKYTRIINIAHLPIDPGTWRKMASIYFVQVSLLLIRKTLLFWSFCPVMRNVRPTVFSQKVAFGDLCSGLASTLIRFHLSHTFDTCSISNLFVFIGCCSHVSRPPSGSKVHSRRRHPPHSQFSLGFFGISPEQCTVQWTRMRNS